MQTCVVQIPVSDLPGYLYFERIIQYNYYMYQGVLNPPFPWKIQTYEIVIIPKHKSRTHRENSFPLDPPPSPEICLKNIHILKK